VNVITKDAEHIAAHHPSLSQAEALLYAEWKRYGLHFKEYLCEFAGTAILVAAIVLIVGALFGDGSPLVRGIPDPALRRLLAGMMIGATGGLVAVSPLGKLSGAHLNPAVSLGFFLLKKMHPRDMAAYVLFQSLGAFAGVLAAALAAPKLALPVHDARLAPAAGLSASMVVALEAAVTFVLCGAIFVFVSSKRLMRFTPLAVVACAGALNLLDGHLSGFGANPARWFGPAAAQDYWRLAACYVFGPLAGAALAVPLPRLLAALRQTRSIPHTGKIVHDSRYRSIFTHDTAPSTIPKGVIAPAGK
jgi:aquaporin Z